ncbi:MAG: hypothetical protein DRH26_19265 [Deltaproteobacteria bacterium]|nr:MAG: hypothetical protein DRH26_19265 [Deltaproteobacteria bacterium]
MNLKKDTVMEDSGAIREKGFENSESCSSLVDRAYDCIVSMIQEEKLKSGDKIVEVRIAKELGISTIPVREAMARLQHDGWIERIPNRGAFVKQHDLKEFGATYEIRKIIELGTIRKVAENITDEQLAELEKDLNFLNAYSADKDWKKNLEVDMHFHYLIVHFAGNPKLDEIYKNILLQAKTYAYKFHKELMTLIMEIRRMLRFADHRQIYEALKAHAVDEAEQLVREHLEVSHSSLVKAYELIDSINKDINNA